MRSHLEFRSGDLASPVSDDAPPGELVATLLAQGLPKHGFGVESVYAEDWGWEIKVANEAFPLYIGCGHYLEYADGHLCFIEPSKPFLRRWFKRIETADTVERLARVIEQIVQDSGKAHGLRWWTEAEANMGHR